MHPYYLAMYMLVNGRWMKKSEAHECGLMAEVMPDWLTLRAGQQPITPAFWPDHDLWVDWPYSGYCGAIAAEEFS